MDRVEEAYRKAEKAIEAGQRDEAVRILSDLAAREPNEPLFQWRLGYVYLDLEKPAEAVHFFSKAISLDADCVPAWGGLAQTHMELGEWDSAEMALRKRLQLRPGPHYYVFLGRVLNAQGKTELAVESCRKALELNPAFDEAWFNLGGYYLLLNNHQEALRAYEKAVALDPSYAGQIDFIRLRERTRSENGKTGHS